VSPATWSRRWPINAFNSSRSVRPSARTARPPRLPTPRRWRGGWLKVVAMPTRPGATPWRWYHPHVPLVPAVPGVGIWARSVNGKEKVIAGCQSGRTPGTKGRSTCPWRILNFAARRPDGTRVAMTRTESRCRPASGRRWATMLSIGRRRDVQALPGRIASHTITLPLASDRARDSAAAIDTN
jgi:hypothetical protein